MATSRKTAQFDLLQLNALKFYNSNNTPIPSSLVLTATGNGQTYFTSISSLTGNSFQTIAVPGQSVLSSPTLTVSSLTSNIYLSTNNVDTILYFGYSNYPNVVSSLLYKGITGKLVMSTLATNNLLSNSGSAQFSSLQHNLSSFSTFINPNGSSRLFIDYYPNFTFGPVVAPSSISSFALYPEGNSSIKSVLALSSHLMFVNTTGSNVPILNSGVQQYMPINSSYPYSVSSFLNPRVLSNTFIQPMKMEFNTSFINSNISIVHYISDCITSIKTSNGNDVFRTCLETSTFVINNSINERNSLFVTITNN